MSSVSSPAGELEPTPRSTESGLKIWNCLNCRKRKIRCDRRDPCAHCTKSELCCSFPATGRTPTRRFQGQRPEDVGWKARQREVLNKLSQLEAVVKELQTDGDATQDAGQGENFNNDEGHADTDEPGMLVSAESGSMYVDNGFWAALYGEVCIPRVHRLADPEFCKCLQSS